MISAIISMKELHKTNSTEKTSNGTCPFDGSLSHELEHDLCLIGLFFNFFS